MLTNFEKNIEKDSYLKFEKFTPRSFALTGSVTKNQVFFIF